MSVVCEAVRTRYEGSSWKLNSCCISSIYILCFDATIEEKGKVKGGETTNPVKSIRKVKFAGNKRHILILCAESKVSISYI